MLLTRPGNKRNLVEHLMQYFPIHKLKIELFFGAGGSFFYMPKSKYNIVNDIDDDVTNLYLVIQNNKELFLSELARVPVSESLLNYWLLNEEVTPVRKAIRFIFLSNFTYLGKGDTLKLGVDNSKQIAIERVERTFSFLSDVKITNDDFRNVIPKINFAEKVIRRDQSFCYLDPIYLNTTHTYKAPKWTENDTKDCFNIMQNEGIPCAMSEFKTELIMDYASDYNMNVIVLKERQNIKNRKVEVLITNYEDKQMSFNF